MGVLRCIATIPGRLHDCILHGAEGFLISIVIKTYFQHFLSFQIFQFPNFPPHFLPRSSINHALKKYSYHGYHTRSPSDLPHQRIHHTILYTPPCTQASKFFAVPTCPQPIRTRLHSIASRRHRQPPPRSSPPMPTLGRPGRYPSNPGRQPPSLRHAQGLARSTRCACGPVSPVGAMGASRPVFDGARLRSHGCAAFRGGWV
jgi:hypothetical protein